MAAEGASYRRYQGQLQHLRFRFVPIVTSGLRLATKRKLPLVLLLAVPACWTVVFCFNVYTKFALEQGATGREIGSLPITAAARFAARLIDVRELIDRFFILSRIFALLVTAWFGAGLLADDRRMGAHLLYFSRPLTRLDYLAGKLICVFLFGALVTLVPGLCVCFTAAVSSPDYEWLAKEGDVVWATLAYGVMTAAFFAIFVLAVSSVASRKSYALAGVFGILMLLHAAGGIPLACTRSPSSGCSAR